MRVRVRIRVRVRARIRVRARVRVRARIGVRVEVKVRVTVAVVRGGCRDRRGRQRRRTEVGEAEPRTGRAVGRRGRRGAVGWLELRGA